MRLADRITRVPFAHDRDRAAEVAALLPDLTGALAELVQGAGACSPYLKSLMEKEADWLPGALDAPETAAQDVLDGLAGAPRDALPAALRQAKRRVALIIALADLGGAWPLEQVTGTLTDLAARATDLAMKAAVANEIRRGKLPGATEDDLPQAAGLTALAMGKMGAGELNYSSDIDLICLMDETRYSREDFPEARSALIRATRRMCAMLSDNTSDGYVFRTDLRLRPDPSVTPVVLSMEAAERYYESLGRTWERAAYIKARACAGDIAAGARFLQTLVPFVWRKHLDFAAIQDAHDMRLRIRAHKGLGGPITLPGHNMKLGRGGIREIEFFTQTRQIIAGGRDPDLRVRGTVEGLAVLAEKGWVPRDAATVLTDCYRRHREVEHRLQMIGDAQTHDLPGTDEGLDRLAAFMGLTRDDLDRRLRDDLTRVHDVIEGFFAPQPDVPPDDTGPEEAGEDEFDSDTIRRWHGYPALRSSRAVRIFQRLRPEILARLRAAPRPSEALNAFDGFLAGLPAGVQLFSLFEAHPQLVDLLIDICSLSPELSQFLSRNSGVFDAVIDGDFFAPWPGTDALRDELAAVLAAEQDYERKLDAARGWAREWHFRIGVHHLRGLTAAAQAGAQYAALAEATVAALWPEVTASFAEKHGPPPGRGAVVLGMGSLGAGRMTSKSDLDLIVIYDAEGQDASDGPRPLAARLYFARLTQALVTALSAPMAQGRLYEVDMRLRPTGSQGPVATSLQSFRSYQTENAWTWEHMALTRARVVAGPKTLAADVTAFCGELLARPHVPATVLADVADMRARIAAAKGPAGPFDLKVGPGRIQDIEMLAQAALLCAGGKATAATDAGRDGLAMAAQLGWIDAAGRDTLDETRRLCADLQTACALIGDKPPDPDALNLGAARFLLAQAGFSDMPELLAALDDRTAAAAAIMDRALARPAEERT